MKPRATIQMPRNGYDQIVEYELDSWLDEKDIDYALTVECNKNLDIPYGTLNYTLEVMDGDSLVATHNLICD